MDPQWERCVQECLLPTSPFLAVPAISTARGQKIAMHIVDCDWRTYDPLAKMKFFTMRAVPYLSSLTENFGLSCWRMLCCFCLILGKMPPERVALQPSYTVVQNFIPKESSGRQNSVISGEHQHLVELATQSFMLIMSCVSMQRLMKAASRICSSDKLARHFFLRHSHGCHALLTLKESTEWQWQHWGHGKYWVSGKKLVMACSQASVL